MATARCVILADCVFLNSPTTALMPFVAYISDLPDCNRDMCSKVLESASIHMSLRSNYRFSVPHMSMRSLVTGTLIGSSLRPCTSIATPPVRIIVFLQRLESMSCSSTCTIAHM